MNSSMIKPYKGSPSKRARELNGWYRRRKLNAPDKFSASIVNAVKADKRDVLKLLWLRGTLHRDDLNNDVYSKLTPADIQVLWDTWTDSCVLPVLDLIQAETDAIFSNSQSLQSRLAVLHPAGQADSALQPTTSAT